MDLSKNVAIMTKDEHNHNDHGQDKNGDHEKTKNNMRKMTIKSKSAEIVTKDECGDHDQRQCGDKYKDNTKTTKRRLTIKSTDG